MGKAPDTGGDSLPFSHLEDRRFEILAFRLKYVELAAGGERVALMQGVGERGRDVVIYSPAGQVTQVVQCKNYSKRFTAPELRKELIKIALHSHLDRSILGKGPVAYELWCPGGLTEPAAKLLNTWPQGWTAQAVAEDAVEVIGAYSSFKGLNWDAIGEEVVTNFQGVVRPSCCDGIIISTLVRKHHPIYEAFFQGKVVMDRDETVDVVRRAVAEGFALLTDKDVKHVVDRVGSFPPEKRIVHTSGYVMGLPHKLVSRFNRKEYESFATHSIQATMGILQVVQNACARLAGDAARAFREDVRPTDKSLTDVFSRTLVFSTIARVNGMIMPGLKLQPALEEYAKLALRERLHHHVHQVWDDYQGCLAGYDPQRHEFGSDEEFRSRIAVHGLDGARTKEEFEQRLLTAIDEHMAQLRSRYDEFMSLVPDGIVVITDTLTAFENPVLFDRMIESTELLISLRGSAIIPD